MNDRGGAGLAGEVGGRGTDIDVALVLLLGDAGDGEGDGGGGHIHDHVHAVAVIPLAGETGADIGLVLVVAVDDFHGVAVHLGGEFLDGLLGADEGGFAAGVAIGAGGVVEHADLDDGLGLGTGGRGGGGERGGCAQKGAAREFHRVLP